jgi:hypothetical protein
MAAAGTEKRGITWRNLEGKGNLANVREFESNGELLIHGSQATRTRMHRPIFTNIAMREMAKTPYNKNKSASSLARAQSRAQNVRAMLNRNEEDPENAAIRIAAERAAAAEAAAAANYAAALAAASAAAPATADPTAHAPTAVVFTPPAGHPPASRSRGAGSRGGIGFTARRKNMRRRRSTRRRR